MLPNSISSKLNHNPKREIKDQFETRRERAKAENEPKIIKDYTVKTKHLSKFITIQSNQLFEISCYSFKNRKNMNGNQASIISL